MKQAKRYPSRIWPPLVCHGMNKIIFKKPKEPLNNESKVFLQQQYPEWLESASLPR